jgi:hypothetical protein
VDDECGEISYLDGVAFSGEQGIVFDVSEADDTTIFESEEGAVTQFIDGLDGVTLWYIREPAVDTLEIERPEPLVFFALWQCFIKENDMQNFAKAGVWEARYRREIELANRTRSKGFLNTTRATRSKVVDF